MVWHRRLILAALAALLFAGCTSAPSQAPRDPRDPDVWRPTAPAVYPLPR